MFPTLGKPKLENQEEEIIHKVAGEGRTSASSSGSPHGSIPVGSWLEPALVTQLG
jgi:hypothetical protein